MVFKESEIYAGLRATVAHAVFILGGTSGRTTLAGEGLQHQDGHSLILSGTVPNCISYDPTYSYELAIIIRDGMRRMYGEQESIYYYITVMNENYVHPAMPKALRKVYCAECIC